MNDTSARKNNPEIVMKLIGTLTSPYVRKARIVLIEKKIDCDFVIDSPWNTDNNVSSHNPLGKVPVLLIDVNYPLFDSRVIVEYLDSLAPNTKLFPETNRGRAEIRRWEALADGICDAAATMFLEGKRTPEQQSEDWKKRHSNKISHGLAFMSEELGQRSYCDGNHFSMADIAAGCALGYLEFRFPAIKWRDQHPNLAKLYDHLSSRTSFAETVPTD